ncbi:MAG: hypothetical protein ABSH44_11095 [Bryobacteraceae bacterium]|jgi:hypothetical protein
MTRISSITLALLATAGMTFAQGGWRRFGDPAPAPAAQPAPTAGPQDPTQPVDRSDAQARKPAPNSPNDPPSYGLPSQLTIKPGTFVTVRVDQMLSSNRNQPGDVFSATLAQPIAVDGVVVAQRGQTVMGRVAEAQKSKAGHDSRLGLELTGLTLADGTQATVHSQLIARQGPATPKGQELGTVATTTAVGASVGAAADWGTGAAVGAGAGAAAGIIGVLLTHNHPTVVYPETALTFRIETPLAIDTTRAPQAFRYVDPNEYDRPVQTRVVRPRPPSCGYSGYGCGLWPYYGPAHYPYPYWGPYYGVGIGIGFGRGYYRRW